MKPQLTLTFSFLVAGVLLAGCCTGGHVKQWEYKRAYAPSPGPNQKQSIELFLNGLAKEGWELVLEEQNGAYIFKRATK